MMTAKTIFCLGLMIIVLISAPVQHAFAAEFNMHLHFYTVEGVAVGEILLEDQVTFQLRIATDGSTPVISMRKGGTGKIIAPDIVNGMFMLRFNGTGD